MLIMGESDVHYLQVFGLGRTKIPCGYNFACEEEELTLVRSKVTCAKCIAHIVLEIFMGREVKRAEVEQKN